MNISITFIRIYSTYIGIFEVYYTIFSSKNAKSGKIAELNVVNVYSPIILLIWHRSHPLLRLQHQPTVRDHRYALDPRIHTLSEQRDPDSLPLLNRFADDLTYLIRTQLVRTTSAVSLSRQGDPLGAGALARSVSWPRKCSLKRMFD